MDFCEVVVHVKQRQGDMKNPHAVALGRRGGKARAKSLTAEKRSEGARKAVLARWPKRRGKTAKSPEG